jgi:hypothetical protein
LIHIKERISKDKQYRCPACKENVIAKKGPKKEAQFTHKPDSDCAANEESILHYYAKHYLLKHEDIEISFPIQSFEKTKKILDILGLTYVPVKLSKILEWFNTSLENGHVEKQVGPYIADVAFYYMYADLELEHEESLVIEVCVTHPMEGEKREHFKRVDIPYIEVTPRMDDQQIQFYVSDCYLPDFFEEGYEEPILEEVMNHTYNYYENDLLASAKKVVREELVCDYGEIEVQKEIAVEQLMEEVDKINFRGYTSAEMYKEMMSIQASAFSNFARRKEIKSVDMRRQSLLCNNMYVNYESRILYNLLKNFQREGIRIEALVENDPFKYKSTITGFNFLFPSTQVTGDQMKRILKEMLKQLDKTIIKGKFL